MYVYCCISTYTHTAFTYVSEQQALIICGRQTAARTQTTIILMGVQLLREPVTLQKAVNFRAGETKLAPIKCGRHHSIMKIIGILCGRRKSGVLVAGQKDKEKTKKHNYRVTNDLCGNLHLKPNTIGGGRSHHEEPTNKKLLHQQDNCI